MKTDWKKVKLGEVCLKIGSGATPNGGSRVYIDSGVSFIRSQNVYNLNFEYNGLTYITDGAAKKLRGVTIEKDDILLNITGDSVARTCIVPTNVLPARVNQHVSIIRLKKNTIIPKFLNYYLASPYMQSIMLGLAVGKGASRNAITKTMIENFEVPCPPLEIQQKIASILSAYDDLIENNRKQIKLLEEAAQRLYKEWFVDLRFPGYENVAIVDGVPEGWRKVKVCDVIKTLPKTKQIKTADTLSQGKIPVIDQSREFIVGYTNDIETLIKSETPIIVFGDHTRILKLIQFPFARGADGTQVFISKNDCIKEYQLYCALKQVDLSNYSYARHFKYLKEIELLVATKNIAEQFELNATEIFKSVQCLRNKIQLLQQARDKLLPRLMSGDMEV